MAKPKNPKPPDLSNLDPAVASAGETLAQQVAAWQRADGKLSAEYVIPACDTVNIMLAGKATLVQIGYYVAVGQGALDGRYKQRAGRFVKVAKNHTYSVVNDPKNPPTPFVLHDGTKYSGKKDADAYKALRDGYSLTAVAEALIANRRTTKIKLPETPEQAATVLLNRATKVKMTKGRVFNPKENGEHAQALIGAALAFVPGLAGDERQAFTDTLTDARTRAKVTEMQAKVA